MNKMALRRLARQPWSKWELRRFPRGLPPSLARPWLDPPESWLEDSYLNNRYSVQFSRIGGELEMLHLWIRRHDGEMPRSWADLQRIKDELVAVDRVAVQVFPAQEDLVDEADMAHLWVFPAGFRLPFGLRRTRP